MWDWYSPREREHPRDTRDDAIVARVGCALILAGIGLMTLLVGGMFEPGVIYSSGQPGPFGSDAGKASLWWGGLAVTGAGILLAAVRIAAPVLVKRPAGDPIWRRLTWLVALVLLAGLGAAISAANMEWECTLLN